MKRRLALRSEHLSDLSSTELASVAGGATSICPPVPHPTDLCNTERYCIHLAPVPTLDCFTGTPAPTLFC